MGPHAATTAGLIHACHGVQGGVTFGVKVHTVGTNPASSAEQRRRDALVSGRSPALKAKMAQEPGAATVDTLDQAQRIMRQVRALFTVHFCPASFMLTSCQHLGLGPEDHAPS